ncbi:GntR family transcriptional regulator [Sphingobium sp. Cam5-1]|uniref:GntR family transcriptional regulator n=1 Tax=Sphingobium sp. Cam5-1 TaxID=2789327 RepID=UPI0018AD1521|nr:GntR family transcriptional regulator [Sphingobium sp. Cam5-1]QPI72226.1 GntR family transcriptional regulator [Sphingobium sp. Cam5-1]
MNAGSTAERVHEALRAQIMSREFRPGDRLDPALLAAPLASSVTPVRDALHRLTGEGLVETRTAGGFHVPAMDEPGLEDLYDWSAELLLLAIRAWPGPATPPPLGDIPDDAALANRTAAMFLAIARHSANREHALAVDRLNARLHAVRTVEEHVLDGAGAELEALWLAVRTAERKDLKTLCRSYHRRRRRAAADIVRAVYRAG